MLPARTVGLRSHGVSDGVVENIGASKDDMVFHNLEHATSVLVASVAPST